MMSAVPLHSTIAVQNATTMLTIGDSSDLICRAFSAASTVALTCSLKMSPLKVLPSECLDGPNRSQALLNDCNDLALPGSYNSCDVLYSSFELYDAHQKEWRDGQSDHGKVQVQPEYQSHHEDDGDDVHENAQS